jgi:hypothetical protein
MLPRRFETVSMSLIKGTTEQVILLAYSAADVSIYGNA